MTEKKRCITIRDEKYHIHFGMFIDKKHFDFLQEYSKKNNIEIHSTVRNIVIDWCERGGNIVKYCPECGFKQ